MIIAVSLPFLVSVFPIQYCTINSFVYIYFVLYVIWNEKTIKTSKGDKR